MKTCKTCIFYLTDEDEHGNVIEFEHNANKSEGFCACRDLFYNVNITTPACEDYKKDTSE